MWFKKKRNENIFILREPQKQQAEFGELRALQSQREQRRPAPACPRAEGAPCPSKDISTVDTAPLTMY